MNDSIYITNKTDKLMHATISDNFTGSSVLSYDLVPGPNEIRFQSLTSGIYLIELQDHNHDIFYSQKITRN
jgi:hypothetical protein